MAGLKNPIGDPHCKGTIRRGQKPGVKSKLQEVGKEGVLSEIQS